MYLILDEYGTRQIAWRWSTAMEWLAACAPRAAIYNRFTDTFIAYRHQENHSCPV